MRTAEHPIDEAGDRLVGVYPLGADDTGSLRRHRTCRLPEDPRQVDGLDDQSGDPGEVQPGENRLDVHPRDDDIGLDPRDDGVQVDAGCYAVQIDPFDGGVEVDRAHDGVQVGPCDHGVDVYAPDEHVQVDVLADQLGGGSMTDDGASGQSCSSGLYGPRPRPGLP